MQEGFLKVEAISLPGYTRVSRETYFVAGNKPKPGSWLINIPGKAFYNTPLKFLSEDTGNYVVVKDLHNEKHRMSLSECKVIVASTDGYGTELRIPDSYLQKVKFNPEYLNKPVCLEKDMMKGGLTTICDHVVIIEGDEKSWEDIFHDSDPEPIEISKQTFTLEEMKVFGLKAVIFGLKQSEYFTDNPDGVEIKYNEWFSDLEKVFNKKEIDWDEITSIVEANTRSKVKANEIINTLKKFI